MLTRPDPTRQNLAKSWPDPTRPDPTRPDPTRGSIRPVDNSETEIQRDRETERQRGREAEKQRQKNRETDRQTYKQTAIWAQRGNQADLEQKNIFDHITQEIPSIGFPFVSVSISRLQSLYTTP